MIQPWGHRVTQIAIFNGTGEFQSVYIDEEGRSFKLVFWSSLVSPP
jgi:hypothetical protein